MRKKIIFSIIFCSLATFANAQVALGGKTIVDGNNTLLDFNNTAGNTNGIILSAVDSAPTLTAANNGTFLFDKSDKRVKMYEKNAWVKLSDVGSTANIVDNTSAENAAGAAIIGATTSTATGVLVLEAPDKAMILPKIATPHQSVKSPYPGMMCYDTTSKTLAVFDGTAWSYWK